MCMAQVHKEVSELKCPDSMRNEIEMAILNQFFSSKNPFPSPVINSEDEVIAFHNTYFLLKELGFEKILCVQK